MGLDNQPKDRQRRRIERKMGRRKEYDRLLIVCEGEETEPNYFNEIRQRYRLSSANVLAIPSEYGTQPQKRERPFCQNRRPSRNGIYKRGPAFAKQKRFSDTKSLHCCG